MKWKNIAHLKNLKNVRVVSCGVFAEVVRRLRKIFMLKTHNVGKKFKNKKNLGKRREIFFEKVFENFFVKVFEIFLKFYNSSIKIFRSDFNERES